MILIILNIRSSYQFIKKVSEARVIEQDVVRTRANEAFFRSSKIRGLMKQTLLRYCGFYHLEYMQGLNEILAPLLMISFESGGMHRNFRYIVINNYHFILNTFILIAESSKVSKLIE